MSLLSLLLVLAFVLAANADCVDSSYHWVDGSCAAVKHLDAQCEDGPSLTNPTILNNNNYIAAKTPCQCTRIYFNNYVGCQLCHGKGDAIDVTWSQWTRPCPFDATTYLPANHSDLKENVPAWSYINTGLDDRFDIAQAEEKFKPGIKWTPPLIGLVSAISAVALVSILVLCFTYRARLLRGLKLKGKAVPPRKRSKDYMKNAKFGSRPSIGGRHAHEQTASTSSLYPLNRSRPTNAQTTPPAHQDLLAVPTSKPLPASIPYDPVTGSPLDPRDQVSFGQRVERGIRHFRRKVGLGPKEVESNHYRNRSRVDVDLTDDVHQRGEYAAVSGAGEFGERDREGYFAVDSDGRGRGGRAEGSHTWRGRLGIGKGGDGPGGKGYGDVDSFETGKVNPYRLPGPPMGNSEFNRSDETLQVNPPRLKDNNLPSGHPQTHSPPTHPYLNPNANPYLHIQGPQNTNTNTPNPTYSPIPPGGGPTLSLTPPGAAPPSHTQGKSTNSSPPTRPGLPPTYSQPSYSYSEIETGGGAAVGGQYYDPYQRSYGPDPGPVAGLAGAVVQSHAQAQAQGHGHGQGQGSQGGRRGDPQRGLVPIQTHMQRPSQSQLRPDRQGQGQLRVQNHGPNSGHASSSDLGSFNPYLHPRTSTNPFDAHPANTSVSVAYSNRGPSYDGGDRGGYPPVSGSASGYGNSGRRDDGNDSDEGMVLVTPHGDDYTIESSSSGVTCSPTRHSPPMPPPTPLPTTPPGFRWL